MPKDRAARNVVEVTNWQACYNSGNNEIVLSCRVSTLDGKATLTGGGLTLVNRAGKTLSSFYSEFDTSRTAELALNLAASGIGVGDFVMGVASGEAEGQHYFEEKKLQITNC